MANLVFSTLKRVRLHLVVVDIHIFTEETDPHKNNDVSLDDLIEWRKAQWDIQPKSDGVLNFIAKTRKATGYAGMATVNSVCRKWAG